MPIFHYEGAGPGGAQERGTVTALHRQEALQQLIDRNIQPSSLWTGTTVDSAGAMSEKRSELSPPNRVLRWDRQKPFVLTRAQVISFTDELADFLDSGMQLEGALQILEAQEENSAKSRVASLLREQVREGTAFSTALRQSSPSFGELYYSLVEAGEISGTLVTLLRRQARFLQHMEDLRQRILMALIYPAFLLGAAALAILVFMTYLVPQMSGLLANTGGTLPLPTLVLLKVGQLFQSYALIFLLVIVGLASLFSWRINQPEGKKWWDHFKLKIPLWGPLLDQAFQAQFCQTLANLLQNGVSLHTALGLMSHSLGNLHHRQLVQQLLLQLGEGNSLTKAMKNTGYFPSALRDLIQAGEQTGELGACLGKVGQRYDKLIQQRIDRIMSLIQPVIVVCMGLMVFLIAWSMMSGIFDAMHSLQDHH